MFVNFSTDISNYYAFQSRFWTATSRASANFCGGNHSMSAKRRVLNIRLWIHT